MDKLERYRLGIKCLQLIPFGILGFGVWGSYPIFYAVVEVEEKTVRTLTLGPVRFLEERVQISFALKSASRFIAPTQKSICRLLLVSQECSIGQNILFESPGFELRPCIHFKSLVFPRV